MNYLKRGLLSFVSILALASIAQARLVGTAPTNPDAWCVNGGSGNAGTSVTGAELCVDYSGNFLPTVTGAQTLGSSSFYWSNAYMQAETVSGSVTEGTVGSTNATGIGGTAATQNTTNGLSILGKVAITGIVTSTSIPVNSSYETLMSTDNTTVSVTALPSISTTTVPRGTTELPSGTYLILTSTGPSGVVLFDDGTLSGSRLQLGASTRTITQFKTLTLIYDAVDHYWREIAYGNN